MEQNAKKMMHDAFRTFDTDESNYIEKHELAMLLRKLADGFHVEHPTESEIV